MTPKLRSKDELAVVHEAVKQGGPGMKLIEVLLAHIAALDADNAALLKAVNDVLNYVHCHSADMGGDHRYSLMRGHGRAVALLQHLAAQPHPGAVLLEEHRKALVRARNEGLERAAVYVKERLYLGPESERIRAMKEPE